MVNKNETFRPGKTFVKYLSSDAKTLKRLPFFVVSNSFYLLLVIHYKFTN